MTFSRSRPDPCLNTLGPNWKLVMAAGWAMTPVAGTRFHETVVL